MLSVIVSSRMACRGGGDMRNEVGQVLITGLAEVDFVAGPHRAAFFAKMSFWIVGRIDKLCSSGNIFWLSPTDLTFFVKIVLYPDLAQKLYGGNVSKQGWRGGSVNLFQQEKPIASNDFCHSLTFRLAVFENGILQFGAHSDGPRQRRYARSAPLSSHNGQATPCKTHGFSNAHQSIDRSYGCPARASSRYA